MSPAFVVGVMFFLLVAREKKSILLLGEDFSLESCLSDFFLLFGFVICQEELESLAGVVEGSGIPEEVLSIVEEVVKLTLELFFSLTFLIELDCWSFRAKVEFFARLAKFSKFFPGVCGIRSEILF